MAPRKQGYTRSDPDRAQRVIVGPSASRDIPVRSPGGENHGQLAPRKQGYTLLDQSALDPDVVGPAQAGIYRHDWGPESAKARWPRASRDIPYVDASTLEAAQLAPRKQGYTPHYKQTPAASELAPRKQGYTLIWRRTGDIDAVGPAQAGIYPAGTIRSTLLLCWPRASRDIPEGGRAVRNAEGWPRASRDIPIEELPGGVLQGYSAVLNLHLRWDQGQLAWYDPATGNPILTYDNQHGRADAERERADTESEARVRAEARVQELEAELRRFQNP